MRAWVKIEKHWWLAATLVLAAFAVYGNVFDNDFLYDDEFLIQKNVFLRSWKHIPEIFSSSSTTGAGKTDSFYRPMQALFYLGVFQAFGLSAWAFHLLNVVLHSANGVLAFTLGRRLGLGAGAGFAGALLWVVHPVHSESITYMSATADPLHAVFVLSGLMAVIPSFSTLNLFAGSLFFALGLLSKEAAIVFPALTVVCLFYMREERWRWRTYLVTLPYWIMAGVYLVLRKTVLDFDDSFQFYGQANIYTESIYVRCMTFLATVPEYLKVLFYPFDLHIDRNFPIYSSLSSVPVLMGAAVTTLALAVVVGSYFGRWVFAAWAILWFLAAHVPHSGILMPMNSLFLEHWLYLSSIGGFLACGAWVALPRSAIGRNVTGVAITAVVALLAVRTWDQNRVWASPVSLYSHILRFNPTAARVHNNLAMAYSAHADTVKAIEHYERAIALSDVYPETRHNLGLAYLHMGRVDDGIKELERAVEMNPDFFFSYEYLAHAYEIKGDRVKADSYRRKSAEAKQKLTH